MNPFASAEALAAFWGRSGEAALAAQNDMLRDLTGWWTPRGPDEDRVAPATEREPETGALDAAQRTFDRSLSAARDMAETVLAGHRQSSEGLAEHAPLLRDILDPRAWFPDAGADAESPIGRTGREHPTPDRRKLERASLAVLHAASMFRQRGIEHDIVLLRAWMVAAEAFARALEEHAGGGLAEDSALALWHRAVRRSLGEVQRTQPFAATFRALSEAASHLAEAERELGDAVAEAYGTPTRSELDELRTTVVELRRELWRLQRKRWTVDAERRDG